MEEPWWRVAGRDLLGLVLPVSCAGCGADDVAWCATCASWLGRAAWRAESGAGRLDRLDGTPAVPVWAVADFAGPVRRAVGAWKDHGRTDLTPVLTVAARRAARAAAPELRGIRGPVPSGATAAALVGRAWQAPDEAGVGPVLVVPAPSTAAARRRRGRDPVGEIAFAVAGELSRAGVAARAAPVLRRAASADQAGLSARARSRNLAGHVHVRRGWEPPAARAVLVDDVLTTGATFAASMRALAAAGVAVVAGVVLAATPHPGAAGTAAQRLLAWPPEPMPDRPAAR